MTLYATISFPYDQRLLALFAAEEKNIGRASYAIEHQKEFLVFSVEANDATALRAMLTTITKILSMWEASAEHGRASNR
jgi:tRNA threonylcarbamoyladenosine modification (KEOPS) complex  Pcc1 subunit